MDPQTPLSKKAAKKQAKLELRQSAAAAKVAGVVLEEDPFKHHYGDVPLRDLQSAAVDTREWTQIGDLGDNLEGKSVLLRGRAQSIIAVGKNIAFVVLREKGLTVQCVVTARAEDGVSKQMVKYVTGLTRESIVDVEGLVSVPNEPIKRTSQKVEVQVRTCRCISRALPNLPFNLEDAGRSEAEFEAAEREGKQLVRVNQDTRLNHRFLDLRVPANRSFFRIEGLVENVFREFLWEKEYFSTHTPKLIAGSSEGGSAVFRLDYKGQPACLAQSPQLHKQMTICGDLGGVFEVGHVFRAEDSFTHRHLCEFIGLDVEMEIKAHYFEIMDVVDHLFVTIFDKLNEKCKKELEVVGKQYPFKPLKYLRNTLRLTFEEGVQMLKDAGMEVDPFGDLNTEAERKLGQLVLEKYDTDFYMLHRFPLSARPFYTMPCYDNPKYSNSFDVFIRGEEIISGSQRIHEPNFLAERAQACGIDLKTIQSYLEAFKYGVPLHGGFGVGLERVAMLFCRLKNIRQASLFPRDPLRLVP